jgi:hypothetical protein
MTISSLPYFLIGATLDIAAIIVGMMVLAERRWRAESRLSRTTNARIPPGNFQQQE